MLMLPPTAAASAVAFSQPLLPNAIPAHEANAALAQLPVALKKVLPQSIFPSATVRQEPMGCHVEFDIRSSSGSAEMALFKEKLNLYNVPNIMNNTEGKAVFSFEWSWDGKIRALQSLQRMYQEELSMSIPGMQQVTNADRENHPAEELVEILINLGERWEHVKDKLKGASEEAKPILEDKTVLLYELFSMVVNMSYVKPMNTNKNLVLLFKLFKTALDPQKLAYRILATETGVFSPRYNSVAGDSMFRCKPGTISVLKKCRDSLQEVVKVRKEEALKYKLEKLFAKP